MGERLEELRRSWRVAVAALIGSLCHPQITAYWFGVAVEPLARSFGQSHSAISAWAAIGLCANCLCAPIGGVLADRLGPRWAAGLALGGAALALASVAILPSGLLSFYVAAVVIFGGSTTCMIAFSRAINENFDRDRATLLGVTGAGTSFAAIIAPKFVQVIVDGEGWRAGFGVMAVVTALALPFAPWLGKSRDAAPSEASAAPAAVAWKGILGQPRLWLMAAALTLYGLCFSALLVNLVPILTDRGLSRAIAAYYAGGVGLGAFFGKLMVGFVVDRLGIAKTGAVVLVLESLAVFCLDKLPVGMALPFVVYLGVAHGLITIAMPFAVAQLFGMAAFGRVLGALLLISGLASLGPYLFNIAQERIGGFDVPLIGLCAILIVSATLWGALESSRLFSRH